MKNTLKVEGMSCGHCVMAVKKELSKLNITGHIVEIGKVVVDTEINNTNIDAVVKAIENAGYKVVETN